jgi:putative ABC transport system permease protein
MRLLPFEYAVRNLGRSPLRLAASIGGSALVVALALAAGSFVRGMERSMIVSGSPQNVFLLGAGSEESVERSQIGMNTSTLAAASVPGIRTRWGQAYVSPEVHMAILLKLDREGSEELNAVIRGFTDTAFLVHPQVRVIEGRVPRQGEDEVMVGNLAATRLGVSPNALSIGATLWFDNRPWRISGRFEAPNTVMDAEIWCPLTDLQIATKRDTLSCVVLTLDDAEFEDVAAFCAMRLDLELVAVRESDYYAGLLRFYSPVRAMVWITATLVALGGLFGGLNTMYAAFAARVRELGTLQTLGFSRTSIVVSFLQESLLATACGGLLAAVAALFFLDGTAVRISMGAFALSVDAPVLAVGLAAGALVAVVGIMPPLWRCLRLTIVEALRTA